MGRRRKDGLLLMPRRVVETLAGIFGCRSAAQLALNSANGHDGPVRFYRTTSSIVVEKLPKQPARPPTEAVPADYEGEDEHG